MTPPAAAVVAARRARRRAVLRIACLLIAVSTVASGCSYQSSAVAPTAQPAAHASATIGLTVVVLTRGAGTPVEGAAVTVDDAAIGRTDSGGAIRTTVSIGTEFHVAVTAAGFIGDGAWGTVASEERWTFYLERQP